MWTTSYLLAGLALLLAWPVPVWLSRSAWTARSPFASLVLWQAIALAGGLSMIGSMLIWGLEPLGDNLLAAVGSFWQLLLGRTANTLDPVHVFALSAALLLGAHLVFTLLLTAVRVGRQRTRHRRLLALLGDPSPARPGTVVVQHDIPVAYCLPGFNGSVTVLSRGLLETLDEAGLQAVVAHERAHLDQRHDVLVLAFASWHQALPWLPTSKLAQSAVQELIEMLADDAALKEVPREVLLRSLVSVAAASGGLDPASDAEPDGAREAGAPTGGGSGGSVEAARAASGVPAAGLSSRRLKRLLHAADPLPRASLAGLLAASALLIGVPTALLVAPGLLG
ncbi:M56 family metallopeptidase [Zafaria sp. J156]|uniref:M56 family metallopeptidase n=1 Tax=Zafaria sp. J156 TaxID=3116490 RepID=UPI002E76CD1A|nr:M56 family metallopeptidase [Zafaria sp. J156]MEE1620248.1 M56 family metallopeptidase [Zafaria sp. J156]